MAYYYLMPKITNRQTETDRRPVAIYVSRDTLKLAKRLASESNRTIGAEVTVLLRQEAEARCRAYR